MRKFIFSIVFLLVCYAFGFSQNNQESRRHILDSLFIIQNANDSIRLDKIEKTLFYLPQIFSYLKTDFEWNTETGEKRLLLRNARLGVVGKLSPVINYAMEVDLSDEGIFRVLKAYTIYKPYTDDKHQLSFWFGYQKPFFSSEYLRSPMDIFFIRRSLVVNDMTAGIVDVGVIANYAFKNTILPFELSLGVMNGMGFKNLSFSVPNYTGRLRLSPIESINVIAQYYGGHTPAGDNLNMWGFECNYTQASFFIEAEYFHRQIEYVDSFMSKKSNGLLIQTYYSFPLKNARLIHYIAPTLRWDILGNDFFAEKLQNARLTAGVNFGIDKTFLKAEFRLNYEKCFKAISIEGDDMFIAEIILSI